MATRHAENLQVCVVVVTFIHLQINEKCLNKRPAFPQSIPDFNRSHREPAWNVSDAAGPRVHLLILLNSLLLGLGDDAFQFVEASLHLGEAHPGILLFPSDAFQLLLAMLLSNAGTLLPLLDTLRKDLIDPTVKNKRLFQYRCLALTDSGEKTTYLAANFMPQSSEQYLEFGLEAAMQPGPKHWRCPEVSRSSPFSPYLVLSLCFCFCLCRRDSFCLYEKQSQLTCHSAHFQSW